uniref:Uncharacterized protein n=1 Tax=Oncorhynchus kisutch TaxID=8019 RepID=A0A8C7FUR4_ONCKI
AAAEKILIVYAHEFLTSQGCKVEVSDLYAMKFKASATAEDVTGKEVKDEHRKPSDVAVVIFQDKKAMLSFTTGSHESMFSANGDHCRYNGNLHYCGFQVLAPQIFWAPTHIPSEACCSMLEAWRTRLEGLLGETPLSFTPLILFTKVMSTWCDTLLFELLKHLGTIAQGRVLLQ